MKRSLVILLFPCIVFAQGTSTGVSYLKLPFTARSASMGEAFVAEPSRLNSLTLNPSNIIHTTQLELLVSHTEWIQDIQSEYFAVAYPVDFGTLAFAVSSSSAGEIEIREKPGPPLATFTAHSASLQASYATTISPSLGVGISAKFLYEKLYIEEATGFALDAGLLYFLPVKGFILGVSVANVGEMGAFVQQETELPMTARLGATYTTNIDDFVLTFGSHYVSEKRSLTNKLHLGAEANYQHKFAFRLGYQSGYDVRSISGGIGVEYEWLSFDYGYVPFSHGLGTAHLFTLGFRL